MPNGKRFLMPDYYPDFSCKMGACRHSCCEGWRVSLSMEDYFRLLGMDCPPDVRRRLDCALYLLPDPIPDEYAEIAHTYDGNCHLRLPDGRCMIQGLLGEDALPPICRLYPRAVRSEGDDECSCAASCEAVTERLLFRREPLTFIREGQRMDVPASASPTEYAERGKGEQALRMAIISLMQDRRYSLPDRIWRVDLALDLLAARLCENAPITPDELLAAPGDATSPFSIEQTEEALCRGLAVMKELTAALDRHGAAITAYGEEILDYYRGDGPVLSLYRAAKGRFESAFPDWEAGFENLIVNHLFLIRFPFAEPEQTFENKMIAFHAAYASLRFLAIGASVKDPSPEHLVDTLSAAFRLIEHSDFNRFGPIVLRRQGFFDRSSLTLLSNL